MKKRKLNESRIIEKGQDYEEKSNKAQNFIESLHSFICQSPLFWKDVSGKAEIEIQTEIRPIVIRCLEKYFENKGTKTPLQKPINHFTGRGKKAFTGEQKRKGWSPKEVIMPDANTKPSEADIIRSGVAENKLAYKLSEPNEIKALLGSPVKETTNEDDSSR